MKKSAFAIAFALAGLTSTGAMAQAYVSGGIGISNANFDCSGTTSCDNNDTAAKFVGGYGFGNGFAAELGFISFGKATASDATISAEVKSSAITLGVAYQLAFSKDWGANFRLGVASMETKVSGTVIGLGSASDSETNTTPYVGVDFNYAVSKAVKLGAGLDFSRAEFQGNKANVRALTFNVRYDF